MIEVSLDAARSFILDVQGLRTSKLPESVKSEAERIHNIQIDTISVVSRSHNLTTFNRYPQYKEGEIWEVEKQSDLFEFWFHAMCMMPIPKALPHQRIMKHTPTIVPDRVFC